MQFDGYVQSRKGNELELPPCHGHLAGRALKRKGEKSIYIKQSDPYDLAVQLEIIADIVHPLASSASTPFAHALVSGIFGRGYEHRGMQVVWSDLVLLGALGLEDIEELWRFQIVLLLRCGR